MAWTGLVLTVDGRNALTTAQMSKEMVFKSIVVGDGAAPNNYSTQKELVHQLYEITNIRVDMTEDGCAIIADFPQMDYDYYFREIGVIVTTEDRDKLYVYDNCGEDAQYIVTTTGVETSKRRLRLSLTISDVSNIIVKTKEILYATYDDFEQTTIELRQAINKNAEEITKIVDGTTKVPKSVNADKATQLETARTLKVNLESTSGVAFDGTKDVTLGVVGVLPIANGGTGAINAADALVNLGITAKATELNYMSGVTSNVQTQLNGKAALASPVFTGTPQAPTASAGTNTTQIATTAFVQTAISNGIAASDAMIVKGTIGTNGTVTTLPTTYKTGWTYRVVTAGTYAGQACEIGDLIIALVDRSGTGNANADWCVAQTNINGAITGIKSGDAYIGVSQSGSVVTIVHKDVTRTDTTSTAKPSHGGTFTAVKAVMSDTKGHVTGVETETVTLPTYGVVSISADGLCPKRSGTTTKFLRDDGTWAVPPDTNTVYSHPTTSGNKHIPSGGSAGQILRWSADGTAVWGADNNTTYSVATQSANGLMSAADKKKLDGIAAGANVNTVTGIKGNAESSYRTGNVNITPANIGLGNVPNVATNDQTPTFSSASTRANITSGEKLTVILGKINKYFADLKTVAFSGSYADLSNKPTIPTKTSQLSNDNGYITGINKTMVTNALGYTPPTADTNTWRPLGTTADTACAGNDSRLSNARPASDVYSWAKASSKPSYTKAEVGLGNVDNTADSAKSVKYANSAGSASTATNASYASTAGQADMAFDAINDEYGRNISITYKMHDDSANVKIQSSAPSDTTALWAW